MPWYYQRDPHTSETQEIEDVLDQIQADARHLLGEGDLFKTIGAARAAAEKERLNVISESQATAGAV